MNGIIITLLFLAAVILQTQGSENLARNKPATQSNNYTSRPASNAVNGVYNNESDFSRTWDVSNQWWTVDLQSTYRLSKVELYNRQGVWNGTSISERLAKVSIYTTTTKSPLKIDDFPNAWTLRHYQEEAYGAVGIILLNRQIPARHVLVHCGADEGLALKEMMVYEERIFAITNTVFQNGESSDHPASAAVDGDLSTYSSTTGSAPYWWKANFSTVVLFKKANVFVTNDSCASQPCGEVSYLTTQDNDAKEPSVSPWDLCNTHVRNNSTQYEVTCDNNYTITKQFGVYSVRELVAFREVQIFGYVLPELNKNIEGRMESSDATSVTVSFLQWNDEMIGELPPTEHRIQIEEAVQFLPYNKSTERVTTTFNNLTINTKYTVEVTCMVGSYNCPGFKQTFSTWTACNGSRNPSYSLKSFKSLNGKSAVSIHLNELNPYCLNITRYTIQMKYENGSMIYQQNITSHGEVNITDLYGFTLYTVVVQAFNDDDFKSSSSRNITTPETSPPGTPASLQLRSNESCVTLSVTSPITPNGIVTHYWLNCTSTEDVSEHRVIPSELGGITSTIMCGFLSDTNITCSAQANNSVGLGEPIFNYTISQLEVISRNGMIEGATTEKPNTGSIAGGVIGTILLLVIVGFIAYFLHRRRQLESKKDSPEFDLVVANFAEAAEGTDEAYNATIRMEQEESQNHIYETGVTFEPISIGRLEWYINTNTEAIKTQYRELSEMPSPETNAALSLENKGKCRYKDLYTSDEHRVVLERSRPDETDFINATFMKGYAKDRQYIASMGPFTKETACDFWLMVWQQNPSAIVMVTRAQEQTLMKCWQYWPGTDKSTSTFGEFTITCRSTDMYPDFAMRYLEVVKRGVKRVIPHFNYLTWPDHDVPDIEVFVAFHRLVKSTIHMATEQPLLVHCSAGVGRTGTYIALDYLLEQARQEGKVDALSCVAEMRTRRPSMIQTAKQYMLLYQALYESLFTKDFTCSPSDLPGKLFQHYEELGNKSDIISVEYKHILDRINQLDLSYKFGKVPENKEKNRFSEIMPCEDYELFLSDGKNGNYINAITVNGCRTRGRWIATQIPLMNTLGDFWELMLEQDVEIIVQLEGTQNPFYLPTDNNSMAIDPFTITRKLSRDDEYVKVIDIKLQKDAQAERKVNILTVKNWTPDSLPPTALLVSVQHTVEKLLQQTENTKIGVVCQDGSTRCGLYICAHNAIEKMKLEQEVDIYYPTMMAKLRRPQFIPTMEQYSYLYQVVKDYAENFGEYANFG